MQEKICLKRTGNTGHFMESERNLYEYSNSFRHHTSGICTTGSEYLRYGLSHHWIKSAIPHRTLKNIQLTTSHRGRRLCWYDSRRFRSISTHYLTPRKLQSLSHFSVLLSAGLSMPPQTSALHVTSSRQRRCLDFPCPASCMQSNRRILRSL